MREASTDAWPVPGRAVVYGGKPTPRPRWAMGSSPTANRGPCGKLALLTIDHVLVDRRCAVVATSVHVLPGSDHRAVFAEVRLPT